MNAPVLPGPLADNPRLDRWVTFPAPGKVTVGTGRVELGQGVLTAMAQIAADELDVAMETHHHPLRRHRVHAERGLYRRQPVDPVRRRGHAAGLRRCARPASSNRRRKCSAARRANSAFATAPSFATALRPARITGPLPAAIDLTAKATGSGKRKAGRGFRQPSAKAARGSICRPRFSAKRPSSTTWCSTAWCMRAWCASPTAAPQSKRSTNRRSSAPPRRRSNWCATAISLPSSATTRPPSSWPAPPRPIMSPGATSRRRRHCRQEALGWCSARRSIASSAPPSRPIRKGRERFEATYTKRHLAHASISPSCGLGALSRRPAHGLDPLPGRVPAAGGAGARAQTRCRQNHRAARAGLRLLRP